jgi:hypothetical protein
MTRATPIAAMVEQMLAVGVETDALLEAIEDAERAMRRRSDQTPLQHYREGGTLIEGVVDMAFQESTSFSSSISAS